MCGLFGGFTTTFTLPEIERIKTLGVLSSLRGMDSTGMAVLYEDKDKTMKATIQKSLGNASSFFSQDMTKNTLLIDDSFLVLGHCRYATVGAVDEENAHPYRVDHIIGAHNGTCPTISSSKPRSTDSYAIIESLAHHGLEKTLGRINKGAYALTWIDCKARTLNFIRNYQRTLWFVWANGTLYWASELAMLYFLKGRGNKGEAFYDGFKEPFCLSENEHFSLSLDSLSKSKKVKVTPDYSFNHTPSFTLLNPKKEEEAEVVETIEDEVGTEYTEEEEQDGYAAHYRAFKGKRIKNRKARALLKEGCAACGDVKTMDDKTHWVSKDTWVCHACHDNDFVKENTRHCKMYVSSVKYVRII